MQKRLLILALLGLGLPACELFGPKCGGEDVPPYFDVEGVSLVAESSTRVLSTGDQVRATDLQLWLRLQQHFYAGRHHTSLLSAAYACDPAPPGYRGTTEKLDSVTVRSRYAYDAQHPAGTSLNDLVRIGDGLGGALTLAQAQPTLSAQRIADLNLALNQGPARASQQQLVVRYRLVGGEVYTAETPVLTIIP